MMNSHVTVPAEWCSRSSSCLQIVVVLAVSTLVGACTVGRESDSRRADPSLQEEIPVETGEEGAVGTGDELLPDTAADNKVEEETSSSGARYTTDIDLTNVVGDWVRASELPSSARFAYPERLEIREGGIYLIPQAEIYKYAPLWQGGAIEAVEGAPDRIRLQSANDAMLEYDWSLGDDALTFVVEDHLEIVYRRMSEGR